MEQRPMNVMSVKELDQVQGGGFFAAVGIATAYLFVLDQAYNFGKGLGAGFYDATHKVP